MTDSQGRKLRVGIVSANWGALAHLPAWRTLPGVEVTAICTSRQESAEAAASQLGVARPFWNYETMAADPDIDIIDAGTSPLLREKIVTAALNGGKHAINQVPFATSYEAAVRIEALRAEKAVQGAAAASVVGLPHLALMKEMIDAGEIGQVFQIHCSWQLSLFLNIMPDFPYTWFGKAGLGVGASRNHGSHMLHAMRHLFGPVRRVVARLETQLKQWDIPGQGPMPVETEDTAHALLDFSSGAMGTFITSWTAADSPGFSLEAIGSKGRLHLTALHYPSIRSATLYAGKDDMRMMPTGAQVPVPERLMYAGGQPVGSAPGDADNGGQRVSLARVFETLVKAIEGGDEPLPSFARAVEVQGIIEAMHESHRRKEWVEALNNR